MTPPGRPGDPEDPAATAGPVAAGDHGAAASCRPRALVLSGSIGRGHDVVAQVCAEALAAGGMEPSLYDCMALLGSWNARLAERSYRAILSRPALYDAFHFSHLRAEGSFSRFGDRAACRRIASRLDSSTDWEPDGPGGRGRVALVLSVFATGAAAGAELALRRPGLRTVVFCTDATVHAMWVHERTDLFVATCELAADTVRRYRPTAEIAVIPAPVRAPFYDPPTRAEARSAVGIREDASCVLLVAGGWGVAPLARSAAAIADAGHDVIAVAGANARLRRQLADVARSRPGVRAFGFTDEMPTLMAASDVVVSGPGQTCHEVRVVGRPLVVLDAVPGHGRENLLHELMLGGASSCSPAAESVLRAVEAVLKSPPVPPPWPVRSAGEWDAHLLAALRPLGL